MSELILEVAGDSNGPLGWVVIDSTVNGRSHGGLRISQHLTREELVVLARRMTLKFGFLGIANGGAKAGIIGNPEAPAEVRRELLAKFASAVQQLVRERRYSPHPDMGTSEPELIETFGKKVMRGANGRDESSFFTSIGVSTAGKIAINRMGERMDQITAAVEGFGKVGSWVAKLLEESGVKIMAISTSSGALYCQEGLRVNDLISAAKAAGSDFVNHYRDAKHISRSELLNLPVDLLCPCANSFSINSENASSIQARIICPGANAPVSPEAESSLISRGIQVLPDFLTNSGGVLGGTMAFAGIPKSTVCEIMTEFLEQRFSALFNMSSIDAERICMERFQKAKLAAETGGIKQKLFSAGLRLYRSGLIPPFIVSRFATSYFRSL
jgi:glutamate dehydrogenase/leucine dehydrogenase